MSAKLAALTFLVAFGLLLGTFTISVMIGVFWVLVMFGSALVFQQGLRREAPLERRTAPVGLGRASIASRLRGRLMRRRHS